MTKYLLIFCVILLSACTSKQTSIKPIKEPKWLIDPYLENDKIAAIGCSQIHIKGTEAQKDLAISRAIDRIATQHSVIVNNIIYRKKDNLNKYQISSSSHSSSLHTVNKVTITTRTKAIYKRDDGEICAWVVQK